MYHDDGQDGVTGLDRPQPHNEEEEMREEEGERWPVNECQEHTEGGGEGGGKGGGGSVCACDV